MLCVPPATATDDDAPPTSCGLEGYGFRVSSAECQLCSPGSYADGAAGPHPTCTACPAGKAAGEATDLLASFEGGGSSVAMTLSGFAEPPTVGSGTGERGLNFDGVDDFVELEPWEIGGAFSVEAFVRFESFHMRSRVIDFGDANGAGYENIVLSNHGSSSGAAWSIYGGKNSASSVVSNDDFFSLGSWVHVVATVTEGGVMTLYKDGVLKGTKKDAPPPERKTRSKHYVGKSNWKSGKYFQGSMRYLAFYDRALTPSGTASTAFRIGLAGVRFYI